MDNSKSAGCGCLLAVLLIVVLVLAFTFWPTVKAETAIFDSAGTLSGDDDLRKEEISLDELRELAAKGRSLQLDDFDEFRGANASFNYYLGPDADTEFEDYIMVYRVEQDYQLIVNANFDGQIGRTSLESTWNHTGGIDIRTEDPDGLFRQRPVRLEVKEDTLTATGATFILKNNSKDLDYLYGEPYTLQRLDSDYGGWVEVDIKNDTFFILPAYFLKPGQEEELTVDWEFIYGELPPGEYRLVKSTSKDTEDRKDRGWYALFARFTI